MNEKEFQNVITQLQMLQGSDDSGHGLDHVFRVLKLAEDFCDELTEADRETVRMIALLHDADDYKLTGRKDGSLENAERILKTTSITSETRKRILDGIAAIGYSKRLYGITPASLEAAVVSDADMCDASGITGILRAYQYSLKFSRPFFDPDIRPMEKIDLSFYTSDQTTTVNHLFEKILRLKDLMLTAPGKREAQKRHEAVYRFLENYFEEQREQYWQEYLKNYR